MFFLFLGFIFLFIIIKNTPNAPSKVETPPKSPTANKVRDSPLKIKEGNHDKKGPDIKLTISRLVLLKEAY